MDQGAAEVGTLLHAAGELPGIAAREVGESDRPQQLHRALLSYSARLRRKFAYAAPPPPWAAGCCPWWCAGHQRRVLEGHADALVRARHLRARHPDLAARGRQKAVTIFMMVDLPQPDGPSTAMNCPCRC